MVSVTRKGPENTARELPVEVYVSMVDALYEDVRSLLLGVLAALAGTVYVAVVTGNPILIGFPFAIVLIAAGRVLRMRAYRRERRDVRSAEQARRWEREYTIGANLLVFTIGLWCLACFVLTTLPSAHLFCVAVALSYMVGVGGRNFANGPFVDNQIALLCAPLVLGMVMTGNWDYLILACFAVPSSPACAASPGACATSCSTPSSPSATCRCWPTASTPR